MKNRVYRGKRRDNGKWAHGYYACFNDIEHRIYSGYAETDCGDYYPDYYSIIPETLGQCSTIPDKNGVMLFEGDIVQVVLNSGAYDGFKFPLGVITFKNGAFGLQDKRHFTPLGSYSPRVSFEKLGDIFSNPNLLEEQNK